MSMRDGEQVHLTGREAFAEALDQAGIAVVRVTERDIGALEALRRDEELARLAAETNLEARRSGRFAVLEVGDIAAVDRAGNVHRLNPYKLDLNKIESQLLEGGRRRLASVTEARAEFETERIALAAFREELMQARMERAGDISHEPADADRGMTEPDIQEPESVLGNMMDKAIGAALDFAADFLAPPPPPTPIRPSEWCVAPKKSRSRPKPGANAIHGSPRPWRWRVPLPARKQSARNRNTRAPGNESATRSSGETDNTRTVGDTVRGSKQQPKAGIGGVLRQLFRQAVKALTQTAPVPKKTRRRSGGDASCQFTKAANRLTRFRARTFAAIPWLADTLDWLGLWEPRPMLMPAS